MGGVEEAVGGVGGIEGDGIQPAGVAAGTVISREHRLKVEVGGEGPGGFVQEVEIPIQVGHEEPDRGHWCIGGLGTQKRRSRQLVGKVRVRPKTADRAAASGNRQGGVVLQQNRRAIVGDLEGGRINDFSPGRRQDGGNHRQTGQQPQGSRGTKSLFKWIAWDSRTRPPIRNPHFVQNRLPIVPDYCARARLSPLVR